MTLQNWQNNGWIKTYQSSKEEVSKLFHKIEEDESQIIRIDSLAWKLRMAYDASLTIATIALRVSGFRTSEGDGHHHRTIDSLRYTIQPSSDIVKSFQDIRKKRHNTSYDGDYINEADVEEALAIVKELKESLNTWLKEKHPEYLE